MDDQASIKRRLAQLNFKQRQLAIAKEQLSIDPELHELEELEQVAKLKGVKCTTVDLTDEVDEVDKVKVKAELTDDTKGGKLPAADALVTREHESDKTASLQMSKDKVAEEADLVSNSQSHNLKQPASENGHFRGK